MSEQNATHVRPAKVFQFAGTLVGTLIGSGFASGQEVMQFFTSYGIPGIVGSLVTTALFSRPWRRLHELRIQACEISRLLFLQVLLRQISSAPF